MELRFSPPELRKLDELAVELCVCGLWSDERPARGLAGLLDWRLAGRLSELVRSGFVTGERGEALLIPGKPHVSFEKVLVLGLGARAAFDDGAYRAALDRLGTALVGLRVRRAVVELPGRSVDAITPENAVAIALEALGASPDHDLWWLVEPGEAQRRIEQRAAADRRRPRVS
jgi:hypothetical protein